MRWFWTVLLLLALLTAALFGVSALRQRHAAREVQPSEQASAAQVKGLDRAASPEAAKASPEGASPDALPAVTPPSSSASAAHASAPLSPAASSRGSASSPTVHVPKPAAIVPAAGAPSAVKGTKPLPPLVPPTLTPAKIGEYDVMGAAMVTRTEDGVAFGDIVIKGEGTQASPYIVPWDALVSAEAVFDPTNNSLRIPEVVAILQDKYVRLDGYVSFPLMTTQPKELLAMLNMWDGCCIGVPPTPYDAVEVQLSKAITGDARYAVSGRVTGKFSVKPYVVKSWLVGLYVMEQAEFTPAQDEAGT